MRKKVYVLMISRVFPAYHPRRGEPTYFRDKILAGQGFGPTDFHNDTWPAKNSDEKKITTIRENYDLWARRAEKINCGEAVLSLRQWSGKPYASKQQEFLQLEKIQVQRFGYESSQPAVFIDGGCKDNLEFHFTKRIEIIAKNDGLSLKDWFRWFKKDFSGCVIQLTDFKY